MVLPNIEVTVVILTRDVGKGWLKFIVHHYRVKCEQSPN